MKEARKKRNDEIQEFFQQVRRVFVISSNEIEAAKISWDYKNHLRVMEKWKTDYQWLIKDSNHRTRYVYVEVALPVYQTFPIVKVAFLEDNSASVSHILLCFDKRRSTYSRVWSANFRCDIFFT